VGVLALFAALVVLLAGLAFFISFIWPSGVAPDTRFYAGRIDDFEIDVPMYFEQHQLFVVRRPDGTFLALYAINPHNLPNECPVEWQGDRVWYNGQTEKVTGVFLAPCHGETFDIAGRRLFGPSPRDLDRFPVMVDGQNVIVRAGQHDLIKGPQRLY
jgi:nitrite reductase/ring-hydroxylating ferredoxin subunit